jgi:hypothetical protein
MGEAGSDPSGDKANHNQAGSPVITNPIYQSPLDCDSEGDTEVFMVG